MQLTPEQVNAYAKRLLSCELSRNARSFVRQLIEYGRVGRPLSWRQTKYLLDLVHQVLPVLDGDDEIVRIDRRLEQVRQEMRALWSRRAELAGIVKPASP